MLVQLRVQLTAIFLCIFLAIIVSVEAGAPLSIFQSQNGIQQPPDQKQDDSYKTALFTGAFTYDYPITVPPGTDGLAPSIFLFFNSQKTNSLPTLTGSGWDLSQSYIERNINYTLNNQSDDSFKLVLDGNEYELVYSAADLLYRTKIETYMRIERLSCTSNEKGKYWQVNTKDGKTLVFGSKNYSESIPHTNLFAFRWYLDSITDLHGNSINYSYSENPNANETGITYPVSIKYNSDQQREILFTYEARNDIWSNFDAANEVRIAGRLKEIQVEQYGSLVRKYVLNYTSMYSNPRSFLNSITEFGSDGSALPPAAFQYVESIPYWTRDYNFDFPNWPFIKDGVGDTGLRAMDVNGDGLTDMVWASFDANNQWNAYGAAINNGSAWVVGQTWGAPAHFAKNGQDSGLRAVDVNGDGLMDFVFASYDASGQWNARATYINNGTGWAHDAVWDPPFAFVRDGADLGLRIFDVNGDGLADLILGRLDSSNNWEARGTLINNGTGWAHDAVWDPPWAFVKVGMGDTGTRAFDINGDGLVDFAAGRLDSSNEWIARAILINNGTGWFRDYNWDVPWAFVKEGDGDQGIRMMDLNGDELIDLVAGRYNVNNEWIARATLINNGTGWVRDYSWDPPWPFVKDGYGDLGVRDFDADGDGVSDLRAFRIDANNEIISRATIVSNSKNAFLMEKVKNGIGGEITLNYTQSTFLNNSGNRSISNLPFNLWVVSSISEYDGINASFNSTTLYNYSGGLWKNQEKDFRGFAVANITLPDGTRETHLFHQDEGNKGLEYKTEIFDASLKPYSKSEYNFTTIKNNSIYSTLLSDERSFTFDGSNSTPRITNTTYSYDNYGNLILRSSLGENGISGDERYEHYQYAYNTSAWILNKPISYNLTDSSNHLFRQSFYYYDNLPYNSPPIKGLLTKEEAVLTGGANPITTYSYDSFGNLINTTDPLNHTAQFIYNITDRTFTFPEKTINSLNQTTISLYDLGTGNLLSTTDSNGIITNYTYD
ncbi:MAG: toxin TcdB middle/N-terminal domain-containing protein, partial [Candidatus Micrarchaeota archaeon]